MLPRLLFLARKSISPTLLWLPRLNALFAGRASCPLRGRHRRKPPAPPKQYHRRTHG
jgi:hypothetical protein